MAQEAFESVRELLESRVKESPGKEFLIADEDGQTLTYSDFDEAVNRSANLLLSRGVRKGDRVSLFLTNRPEYLILYFACFKIGAWAGPINALLKPPEIRFVLQNSEAGIAVTESDLFPVLIEAAQGAESLREIVLIGSDTVAPRDIGKPVVLYREALRSLPAQLPTIKMCRDDEAMIIYTSGTTGKPKGVLLTHGNLLTNAREIAEWLHLDRDDRALMIMPLFHVNALMTTGLAALWAGGSVVIAPKFSASKYWETVARYGVTYFGSVATMLSMLNHTHESGVPDSLDTSRLRFGLCGSAPVPVEVMKQFEELFKCPVIEGYGLSECTCRATFNPPADKHAGSVGLPIGNEVKVFDENDREVDDGCIGEIVLRGANVMKGYYRNPEATREAFRSDWFHTGDLGYRDRDGFFYVIDRKSDMIIRAGENIYPREIDEVLYKHPKVRDAATIGVPDDLYGEEVKSFIVARDGQDVTAEELIAFCRNQLADYKCPKSIEFLDDIPKGPTGKLLKRELIARLASVTS